MLREDPSLLIQQTQVSLLQSLHDVFSIHKIDICLPEVTPTQLQTSFQFLLTIQVKLSAPLTSTLAPLTITGLGRPWSGEQMALKGRPNRRPRVGDSEVGDRGRPSSCVLDPFQKGQLIRERFLLKVFCWAGSAGRHISHMNARSLQSSLQ